MAFVVAQDVLGRDTPVDAASRLERYGLTLAPAGNHTGGTCIVFVHGLGGHVVDTWRDFPRLLTADPDLRRVDIGFFGYKTSLLDGRALLRWLGSWLPVARRYGFEAKGRELADELRALQRLRAPARIILAAHSLGGLIVLEALRQLVQSGEPERLSVARCVSALVFYGTPFLGSDRVNRLTALMSPDFRALLRVTGYRDTLGSWVAERLHGHLLRLDETYARVGILYSSLDTWVDIKSAQGRFPEGLAEQWNVSHTALCKPGESKSRPYLLLKRFVNLPPPAPQPTSSGFVASATRVFTRDTRELQEIRALYEDRLPENERVSWDVIMAALHRSEAVQTGRDAVNTHSRYLLAARSREGPIVAFAYAHHRQGEPYAWLAYLVAERARARGLGTGLGAQLAAHLRQHGHGIKGLLFEVESPDAAVAAGVGDQHRVRRARIRLYASLGAVYAVTGLNYRQPRLSPETTNNEEPMHLLYAPVPPTNELQWLTRDEVVNMLSWIREVQRDAYADHPRAGDYGAYLECWMRELARSLGDCVRVEPARVLLRRPR